jgi:hypothetical protein
MSVSLVLAAFAALIVPGGTALASEPVVFPTVLAGFPVDVSGADYSEAPATITLGGDGRTQLVELQWSNWGAATTTAQGTWRSNYAPAGDPAQYYEGAVNVQASDIEECDDHLSYTQVSGSSPNAEADESINSLDTLLLAAWQSCGATTSVGTPPTASTGCPAYRIIDSRGSGEAAGATSPPGASFAKEFARLHQGGRIARSANPYPAVGLWGSVREVINLVGAGLGIGPLGAYHASVEDGEKWLAAAIANEIANCPRTRLLLTGYSQGAQVTADVYQRHLSALERTHILGVALFGDPYFDPADATADRSTYLHSKAGILGDRPTFGRARHVVSYCHRFDPVCQRSTVVEIALHRLTQHENYKSAGILAAKEM